MAEVTNDHYQVCICSGCSTSLRSVLYVLPVVWMCGKCNALRGNSERRCHACGGDVTSRVKTRMCHQRHSGPEIHVLRQCVTKFTCDGAPIYDENLVCTHNTSNCTPYILQADVCGHLLCSICLCHTMASIVDNNENPPMTDDRDDYIVLQCPMCVVYREKVPGHFDYNTIRLLPRDTYKTLKRYSEAEFFRREAVLEAASNVYR